MWRELWLTVVGSPIARKAREIKKMREWLRALRANKSTPPEDVRVVVESHEAWIKDELFAALEGGTLNRVARAIKKKGKNRIARPIEFECLHNYWSILTEKQRAPHIRELLSKRGVTSREEDKDKYAREYRRIRRTLKRHNVPYLIS